MRSHVELSDGGRIQIRPIGPADREALDSGFARMGPESRQLRFFGPVIRLTGDQLTYLTDVDHHDHEALVAIDADSGEGIGVARFVRLGDDVAEPAVSVVDEWQGRGVGSLLLDELADRAREEGIGFFAAPVLAQNETAISLLSRLGDATMTNNGSEVEVLVALEHGAGGRRARPAQPPPSRRRARDPALGRVLAQARARAPRYRGAAGERDRGRRRSRPRAASRPRSRRRWTWRCSCDSHGSPRRGATTVLDDSAADVEARLQEIALELRGRGLAVERHTRRGDLAAALIEVAIEQHAMLIAIDGHAAGPGRVPAAAWDHVAHHAPVQRADRPPRPRSHLTRGRAGGPVRICSRGAHWASARAAPAQLPDRKA